MQGHNRYWSANTDYAKQNGGKWEFLIDDASQYALPLEQGFWDWLMMESRKWGLAIYEQVSRAKRSSTPTASEVKTKESTVHTRPS